ncbi:MAG: SusC/RagA family TonB-linked outer membrane protein [Pedobacter sp.]|nr:MAG: SusC/RagA family TonB-linked outer membrane protein [Pedobacter sp.]
MKRKLLMLFFGVFLLAVQALAQEKTVTGKITSSDDGSPIPGVTVKVKSKSTVAASSPDGTYAIKAAQGDVLVFTYLGMLTKEMTVGSGSVINVVLESTNSELSEVVIVGYGTQKKANLTGAITTIDVDKTLGNGRPISDVGRALQGAAAGLSITVPSAEVGSDPTIKIRGALGSFQGGSSPLILVDNVEIPSIQLLNPDDIASITILKDASASSIYGSKASFGVVLITTKQGSNTGKPQINYSNNFSYQNVWKDLQMADVSGLKYTMDAMERIGTTTPVGAFYYVDKASYQKAVEWKEKYGNVIGADDPTVYGRDWFVQNGNQKMGLRTYDPYEYMIKEWAPTGTHNLSISNTIGKTTLNLGLGLLDQSGMVKPAKEDKFTRYNASLKLSTEVNKHLTIRGGTIFSRRNKEYAYVTNSAAADPWLYLYRWSTLYPLGVDENGDLIRSPYGEMAMANTANILTSYVNVNLGSTVKILDNWRVDFDYTFSNNDDTWNRPGTRYTARDSWSAPILRKDALGNQVYVNNEGVVVPAGTAGAMQAYDLNYATYTSAGANPDHIGKTFTNLFSHTINATTTYETRFGDSHDFKIMAGLNRVTSQWEQQAAQITNLTDIYNPQFRFAIGTQTTSGDKSWDSQLGYFSRVNYAYQNKYLLEGSIRYDGSSKFPEHLWWRWYPSFSAGWIMTEENFMAWSKNIFNMLKVRYSYGMIGDQSVNNGLYISRMTGSTGTWIGSNNQRVNQVGSPTSVSANIQWQDIISSNFGIDASFLRNRLNFTFELFKRTTDNMIVPAEGVPLTFGISAPQVNSGSLATKGWELSMSFNHRFDNGLGINLGGNISDANTFLESYGSGTQVNGNYNGKNIGEIWGYRTDRLYQMSDFELGADGKPVLITLTANESALHAGKQAYKLKPGPNGEKPVYQPFLQNSANFRFGPGDVKFRDLNGDGEISNGSGTLADHGDLEIIGNSNPRYEYGFRLGADFKGFDVSAFFQGVGKRAIWGAGFLAIPGFNTSDGSMPEAITSNYWTPDRTDAFYPAAYNNGGSGTTNNMQVQDRYLLNMAYLRLKNLTLGYTFPKLLVNKAKINNLRVYVALENFITWDKLGDLPIDPETVNGVSFWSNGSYNAGRTATAIPAFKSASFGVQLNF